MSATELLTAEQRGPLLVVTINRPAKLNAFTNAMYARFGEIFRDAAGDTAVRCVLLRAAGDRAFCVGSDIGEFNAAMGQPEKQVAETRIGRAAADAMAACPHPIVAAIKGVCAGGGLQLATLCDLRVASDNAAFSIPIKKLNMYAEIEDLAAMHRTLGLNLCMDLLLSGRAMGAEEALRRGFLHRTCPLESVDQTARALAEEIAAGAPLAARWHKKALRLLSESPVDFSVLGQEALACYGQRDFAEGCAAFAEKRPPVFKGR